MLLRFLSRWLCRSRAELRRVWRLLQRYRALAPEEQAIFRLNDKRIRRSMRLSLLWAFVRLQLDKPHVVVMGLVGIVGLLVQGMGFGFKHFVHWVR